VDCKADGVKGARELAKERQLAGTQVQSGDGELLFCELHAPAMNELYAAYKSEEQKHGLQGLLAESIERYNLWSFKISFSFDDDEVDDGLQHPSQKPFYRTVEHSREQLDALQKALDLRRKFQLSLKREIALAASGHMHFMDKMQAIIDWLHDYIVKESARLARIDAIMQERGQSVEEYIEAWNKEQDRKWQEALNNKIIPCDGCGVRLPCKDLTHIDLGVDENGIARWKDLCTACSKEECDD
jgi:hypothetical protein